MSSTWEYVLCIRHAIFYILAHSALIIIISNIGFVGMLRFDSYVNLIIANTIYFAEFRLHKTWEPIPQKVSQPMHLHTIKWALVIERESTDWTLWWVDEQKIAAQTTIQRNHSEFWPEERSQSKNNKIKQKKSEISHSVCSFICLPKSYGLLFCYANTVHFTICKCVCVKFIFK